jgi:XTP/dITP diphosphohydrolase
MEIVLATRNKKKIEEITRITRDLSITILSLENFPNCRETVEDKDTFEGNAVKKAVEVCQCTGKPALADDSGLEVDALGGAPGPLSARFGGKGASDRDKVNLLLSRLRGVPWEKRSARFRCVIAVAAERKVIGLCEGVCEGIISLEAEGEQGFGYDPVFYLPELHKTMAELTLEEKNRLSHRAKAAEKAVQFLQRLREETHR